MYELVMAVIEATNFGLLMRRRFANIFLCLLLQVSFFRDSSAAADAKKPMVVIGVELHTTTTTSWNVSTVSEFGGFNPDLVDVVVKYYSFGKDTTEISHLAVKNVIETLANDSLTVFIGPYNPVIHLATEEERLPYLVTTDGANGELHHQKQLQQHPHPHHHHQHRQLHIARRYTLSMRPASSVLSTATMDVMRVHQWDDITFIYDTEKGFRLLEAIMAVPPHKVRGWKLSRNMSDVAIRDELLNIRQMNLRRIVVACEPKLMERVFNRALRLSMLSENYFWIVADLNPFAVDFEIYGDTRVNLTLFQYFDQTIIDSLAGKLSPNADFVQDLLIIDSLLVVNSAIMSYLKMQATPFSSDRPILGTEIMDLMRKSYINGTTGQIEFDSETGTRKGISLLVMTLTSSGLKKIGEWHERSYGPESRLHFSNWTSNQSSDFTPKSRFGRDVVRIVTVLDPPFVMCAGKDICYPNETKNSHLEGFLIDMIQEIANHKTMKFKYELYLSPDGNYGSKNAIGEWNGMIKELMLGEATMCLGAISITAVRETAVDFTKPFKQKQFNLLMKKPSAQRSLFQFLWPLSRDVWLLTMTVMVVVGMLLFVMDRITPNSKHSEERFDLHESLFFIYGTLVGPGTEMVPRTISGRILSMAWWFFGMILVSSYTANLAAVLTVTKIETSIKSVADLAAQTKIKYGTVRNTYAMSMFQNSEVEIYKKMWSVMEKIHPDAMVANTNEGINKVLTEDYAFIWDQPINDYLATNLCGLISTGEPFDEKGYGIGVPTGAAYRDDITMVILDLQESGRIKRLEDKWWKGGKCPVFKDTTTGSKELQMENVGGVFLVLAAGAGFSFVICLMEFVITKINQHRRHLAEAVKLSMVVDDNGQEAKMTKQLLNSDNNQQHSATMSKESSF